MERLASAGIYTGVTMMPLLPYLNDSTDNITSIIQRAADCGASYIIPMFGVTMRKGSREYLYNKLDSIAPGLSLLRQNLWRKIRMFFARLYQPTKGL